MKRVLLMTLACLVATTSVALAGTSDDARFALHLKAPTTKAVSICTTYSPNAAALSCRDYNTVGPAGAYSLVYMVVGQGPAVGIFGVSFGVDYNGRAGAANGIDPDYNTLTLCADGLPFHNSGGFGDFPAPKGGTRITWVNCQQTQIGADGVHAVIAALQLYAAAPDLLKLTPNENLDSGRELAVASCDGQETQLLTVFPQFAHDSLVGKVALGGGVGYTPCGVVSDKETSWGKIKDLYKN